MCGVVQELCEAATDSADVLTAKADLMHAQLPYTAGADSELAAAVAARFIDKAEAALARAEASIKGEAPLDYEDDVQDDASASDGRAPAEVEVRGCRSFDMCSEFVCLVVLQAASWAVFPCRQLQGGLLPG